MLKIHIYYTTYGIKKRNSIIFVIREPKNLKSIFQRQNNHNSESFILSKLGLKIEKNLYKIGHSVFNYLKTSS